MTWDLQRFVDAQQHVIDSALRELRAGRKTGHWIWFVFPQIAGLGHSEPSRYYAIGSRDEARAYLADPVLGSRLRDCAAAVLSVEGHTAEQILGSVDAAKLRSSMTLFLRVAPDEPLFREVLHRYDAGLPDPRTDELLGHPAPDGRYPSGVPPRTPPLPADDPELATLTLDELELRWSTAAARTAITAEAMTGADLKTQALGTPGEALMEHAGTAVAAAARALVAFNGRADKPVLILAGPGNNGGDGFVAARVLAGWGTPVIAVLIAADERPGTPDALRNWKRLDGVSGVTRIHAPVARDVAILGQGIEKAAIVVDALLGTGVRGQLREPVRTAVEIIRKAREAGIPVLAVDTPTAVDLTSGDPSDPVVRADLTVTFHRPKTGLRTRMGRALAGRILVAPIGIPPEADRG